MLLTVLLCKNEGHPSIGLPFINSLLSLSKNLVQYMGGGEILDQISDRDLQSASSK